MKKLPVMLQVLKVSRSTAQLLETSTTSQALTLLTKVTVPNLQEKDHLHHSRLAKFMLFACSELNIQ